MINGAMTIRSRGFGKRKAKFDFVTTNPHDGLRLTNNLCNTQIEELFEVLKARMVGATNERAQP